MKDIHEVLRQKEIVWARLQKEIESLRLVIPLLAEDEAIPESVAQVQTSRRMKPAVKIPFLYRPATPSGASGSVIAKPENDLACLPRLECCAPAANHTVQIVAARGVYAETASAYAKSDRS